MKVRIALVLLLLSSLAAFGWSTLAAVAGQTGGAPARPPIPLTAYVPQDALLAIESPDFASLLSRWTGSTEARAWLASGNRAVFANSRLFGRLSDARDEFAKTAGIPAGCDLLQQVAGGQSVFAWYDIGNLEFLYITRMPAAQAQRTALLQARGSFARRHAGSADFYIRTSAGSPTRTVAFAQVSTAQGDLLVLATREDLMANALKLISATKPDESLAHQPWFQEADAALPGERSAAALHMVLNLDRLVPTPYFRSYWIQRNITAMKQYRAAVSDLYLEPSRFREERALLLKSSPSLVDDPAVPGLAALVPPDAGVFRAVATHAPADAITALDEKLLGRYSPGAPASTYAPDPSLAAPQTGSEDEFETQIDAPAPVAPSASDNLLADAISAAGLDAVLTVSSAQTPLDSGKLWIPIHSAVVLHAAHPFNQESLAAALQQSLRGSLTAASLGIEFKAMQGAGPSIDALAGPKPLFFAVTSSAAGNLAIFSDDVALLRALLEAPAPRAGPASASYIGSFNHASQLASSGRLLALVDGTNGISAAPGVRGPEVTAAPAFFSGNAGSLSRAFAALEREQVVQTISGGNVHQTVIYSWAK